MAKPKQQETDTQALAPTFHPDKTEWTRDERVALVERAQAGDKSVRQELRAMFAADPETVRRLVNRPFNVTTALVLELADTRQEVLAIEILPAYAALLLAELEGEHPTALERLLCERVVGYWMAAYLLDTTQTVTTDTATGAVASMPAERAEWESRMKTRAAERFNTAALTLARVRRLLRPDLAPAQVNVALTSQQLNIAGPGEQPPPLLGALP